MPPEPVAQVPGKTNPWVIALVVIGVICCCCVGFIGLVFGFWEPIQQFLQSLGLFALFPTLAWML